MKPTCTICNGSGVVTHGPERATLCACAKAKLSASGKASGIYESVPGVMDPYLKAAIGDPTSYRLHAHLTRREQFAMAAMQGLLANPVVQESSVKIPELAGEAIMYADALIAALDAADNHNKTKN